LLDPSGKLKSALCLFLSSMFQLCMSKPYQEYPFPLGTRQPVEQRSKTDFLPTVLFHNVLS
jgi:hypothetical protein